MTQGFFKNFWAKWKSYHLGHTIYYKHVDFKLIILFKSVFNRLIDNVTLSINFKIDALHARRSYIKLKLI